MKTSLVLTLSCLLIAPQANAGELEERAAASRIAVKEFMGVLKGQLKAALKTGGPVKAIEACNITAPTIAKEQSGKRAWTIGRTSMKLRNQNNAPDLWEIMVLSEFEARKAAGEDPKKIEFYEVTELDGKQVFRYMKAIPTAEKPCLICHGTNIKPKLAKALDKLYPNDQARGFKAGDIRGAFTIIQPLEK